MALCAERSDGMEVNMEILEFGDKEKEILVLIHGFQSPYQVWEEYIKYYENDYHIIVPILQGHNPKIKEDFISFNNTANEIADYIISHYGNNVYAIYGMSLGGIITANIWQNKKLNIQKIILDGSPIVSYPKILKSYLTNFYINVTHKSQQRDEKTINQAINTIVPKNMLNVFLEVLDSMSDKNIINYLNEWGNYKLPNNIDVFNTEIYYFHGTKMNEMLAKKSAKYLKKYYPSSNIICLKGKFHCETSIFNPNEMIKELDKIFNS